jgi:hypothetical protein
MPSLANRDVGDSQPSTWFLSTRRSNARPLEVSPRPVCFAYAATCRPGPASNTTWRSCETRAPARGTCSPCRKYVWVGARSNPWRRREVSGCTRREGARTPLGNAAVVRACPGRVLGVRVGSIPTNGCHVAVPSVWAPHAVTALSPVLARWAIIIWRLGKPGRRPEERYCAGKLARLL